MYALTAAHKTLPMGTYVRVHHQENGKEVVVRINDRGPFVRGRIIDLSYKAAKEIGLVGQGTAPVKIVALGRPRRTKVRNETRHTLVPDDYTVGAFSVQVGAFREKKNALRLRNKLAQTYKNAHIAVSENGGRTLFRVRVARCRTLGQARQYEKALRAIGYPDAVVVRR